MHGNFHQLMDTKSYVGSIRTSILSILWVRHGSAFYPLYPILALIFRHNINLSPSFSITASNLLLASESGVGKLEGRTSQHQAFAYAIAWLLIPALLSLAHFHRLVAIASISQDFLCFHPTPRGGLRLDFIRRRFSSQNKIKIVCDRKFFSKVSKGLFLYFSEYLSNN